MAAEPRAHYRTHGVAPLGRLLDEATTVAARHAVTEAFGDALGSSDYGVLVNDAWRRCPPLEAIIRSGRLGQAALSVWEGPALVLFQDNLIWKPPGTTQSISWHQDYSYWPLDKPLGVTLWVALDDADEACGGLEYIPGTHDLGERAPAPFIVGADAAESPLPPLDVHARLHDRVSFAVPAGHALAHHPLTWHTSGPNLSMRQRRGWSLTFVAPEVAWEPAHAAHPFVYDLIPMPGERVDADPRFPVFHR